MPEIENDLSNDSMQSLERREIEKKLSILNQDIARRMNTITSNSSVSKESIILENMNFGRIDELIPTTSHVTGDAIHVQ